VNLFDPRPIVTPTGAEEPGHHAPATGGQGFLVQQPSIVSAGCQLLRGPENSATLELAVPLRIHAANLPVAVEGTIAVEVNYKQVEPWTISAQREEEE
jgi:hypothetical protein